MSNFAALIATIQANIKTNGNEEITGAVLQDVLEAMVQALGTEAINNLETALGNEETARQNADGTLQDNIDAEALRAGTAEAGLAGDIAAEELRAKAAEQTNAGNIATINGKIPSAATAENQLADKAFVMTLTTALQNAINAINTKLAEGYVYAGIATPSTNPSIPTGKVFYIATAAGTYTNFLDGSSQALVLTRGINILKFNGTAWSQEQLIGIDDEPTPESENLVTSNGVMADFSKYNRIGLTHYAGIVIANFNTGQVINASGTSNGYLIEVLPETRYKLSSAGFLLYGGSSIQCYSGNPRTSASDKNLGRTHPGTDNTFVTNAGTKYILISVNTDNDDGKQKLWYVDDAIRTELNELTEDIEKLENNIDGNANEILELKVINTNLLDTLDGIYCTNFNTGAVTTDVDSTHDGLLQNVKEGIRYAYTGNNLLNNGIVEFYSDNPKVVSYTTCYVGKVTMQYSENGYYTFTAPATAKYVLISINPTGYDFKAVLKPSEARIKQVLCYGDSLTRGGNETADVSYPSVLQSRLGSSYDVINKGVGGISSLAIMGLEGFAQMRLVGTNSDGSVTIPSNGTPVDIAGISIQRTGTEEYETSLLNSVYMFTILNNISLEGYENYGFALGWNSQTSKLTVRVSVGSPSENITTSPRPCFNTYDQRNPDLKDPHAAIFWMGTNGAWDNAQELMSQYEKMTTLYKTRNYLVLGLTASTIPLATRVSVEKELEAAFGSRFVNIREYLLNFGLRDAGITPTADDIAAIQDGNVPPSLLVSDGIHFNDAGYTVIAGCLYNRFLKLHLL